MNNNEIADRRNQAISEANNVYNKIVQNQTDLVNKQGNQIDSYLANSESAINQSVNNNISALQNASETAKRQQLKEREAVMKNYGRTVNNVDETTRVNALNSVRNRLNTSESSVSDMIQEYNNQIAQAKITGQSIIAQQALDMLKEKFNLYNQGMNNINEALIGKQNNALQLTKDYASFDNQYSNANNAKLNREEDARQFNQKLAYNNDQLKIQKSLKEQEYQLDLRDAKEAYYGRTSSGRSGSGGRRGRSSSGSSGGYAVSDNSVQTSNNISGNIKLYANYTPTGLSKSANKVYSQLTKSVLSKGYITGSQLASATKNLSKAQQSIIYSAFKQGTLKTTKTFSKTTTKKTSSSKTSTKKTTTKKTSKSTKKPSFASSLWSKVTSNAKKSKKKK